MKRFLSVIFLASLLLCSCGGEAQEETTAEQAVTEEATAEQPVTEETTAAEEATEAQPVDNKIRNPLNGRVLEKPFDGRAFAVSVSCNSSAVPLRGVSRADVFFEMLSSSYETIGLALFSDVRSAGDIGPVASARYMFSDLGRAFDFVLCHAGATAGILRDMSDSAVEGINAEFEAGYRDTARELKGYNWDYTLFAKGEEIYKAADKADYSLTGGVPSVLRFTDEATPENGSDADEIEISFTLDGNTNTTLMTYNGSLDKYIFRHNGKVMSDESSGTDLCFTNVIVLYMTAYTDGVYHVYDFSGEGDGLFACGGKSIPVKWAYSEDEGSLVLMHENGSPLYLEAGNTYIALCVK